LSLSRTPLFLGGILWRIDYQVFHLQWLTGRLSIIGYQNFQEGTGF